MRTVVEEVISAVTVTQVIVLPRLTVGGRLITNGLLIDQDFDDSDIELEVASLSVRPGQLRGSDLCVVLRGVGRAAFLHHLNAPSVGEAMLRSNLAANSRPLS